jgi:hypothetical protein
MDDVSGGAKAGREIANGGPKPERRVKQHDLLTHGPPLVPVFGGL